ncbi:EspA/EspE family type VII secretion system effector [Mycobacterium sp. SMC-4]|uniref:EspA/EspE family type VII secretion system effector n=1 Tax=Mycobacterium sp. SMC-4 TaxID=2857059 RepID=UPI003D000635
MSALDGFLTTWSRARAAFGSGEPQPGQQFDRSIAQLQELHAAVQAAVPGDQWSGSARPDLRALLTSERRTP